MNALLLATILVTNDTGVVVIHPVKDEATYEMLRVVAQEKDPAEREAAENALAFIRDPGAAGHPSAPARRPARPAEIDRLAQATAENRAEVLQLLNHPLAGICQQAVRTVQRLQFTDVQPALLPLLENPDSALRRTVCETITDVPSLARQLARDDDPFVRRAAADRLLGFHSEAARAALLPWLRHERAAVRQETVRVLGLWAEPALAMELHFLLDDPEPDVAGAAAEALGKLHNPESVNPLLERAANAPVIAQERFAWALGELRTTAAVPVLLRLLQRQEDKVEAAAAEALGKIGDQQAVGPLREILPAVVAHHSAVRQQAIAALRRLGDRASVNRVFPVVTERILPPPPMATEPLYETDEVRAEGLRYLAHAGDATLAAKLLTSFKDLPSFQLREVLAETITRLTGDPYRAIPEEDIRHYSVESLAVSRYPWLPPTPGVGPLLPPDISPGPPAQ
jgi:HEAT repeat protein